MWYVYMLLCDRKTFYIGIAPNVRKRLVVHRAKHSFFTKKFSDVQLVYAESHQSKHAGATREVQLKGWTRAKKQQLVDGTLGINRCELDELLGG